LQVDSRIPFAVDDSIINGKQRRYTPTPELRQQLVVAFSLRATGSLQPGSLLLSSNHSPSLPCNLHLSLITRDAMHRARSMLSKDVRSSVCHITPAFCRNG